jgi:hypothetical protein
MFKIALCIMIAVLLSAANLYSQDGGDVVSVDKSNETEGVQTDAGTLYGREFSYEKGMVEVEDLVNSTETYDGKIVIARGKISDVCQSAGCWLVFNANGTNIRVKTNHEFLVPPDITGRYAVIEGRFKVVELDEDMANHYNEESVHKAEEIKGSVLALEIDASGVIVLNDESLDIQPVK